MPEKSTVAQVVQIGVETTPGTLVAATKRLSSLSIEPKMEATIKGFRPEGRKFTTLTQLSKEWGTAKLSGIPTFEEIIYLLSSLIDTATITTPATGTNSRQWTFVPDPDSPDAPKTFSVEKGDANGGVAFPYMLVNGLRFACSREEISIDGDALLAKAVTQALTSSGVTALATTPFAPSAGDIYLDGTYATIGTTKLTRAFKLEFGMGERYKGIWPINSANGSFAAHVEGVPKADMSITVAADTDADAFLTQMRANGTKFIRYEVLGPVIELALRYRFTFDAAVNVLAVKDYSDEDGVYAQGFDLAIVDAPTLRGFKVEVVNTATAL